MTAAFRVSAGRRMALSGKGDIGEEKEMLPYGKVEAVRAERAARFVEEKKQAAARRKAARNEPGSLGELLDALAQGLAGLSTWGGGSWSRPVRPAF